MSQIQEAKENNQFQGLNTTFVTAITLSYTIGAGITAAAIHGLQGRLKFVGLNVENIARRQEKAGAGLRIFESSWLRMQRTT
jgi:hypothetical protein